MELKTDLSNRAEVEGGILSVDVTHPGTRGVHHHPVTLPDLWGKDRSKWSTVGYIQAVVFVFLRHGRHAERPKQRHYHTPILRYAHIKRRIGVAALRVGMPECHICVSALSSCKISLNMPKSVTIQTCLILNKEMTWFRPIYVAEDIRNAHVNYNSIYLGAVSFRNSP